MILSVSQKILKKEFHPFSILMRNVYKSENNVRFLRAPNVTSTITAREDHQKRQFHVTINTLVTGELKCKYFALQVVTSSLKPDGEPSINALHVHQANIQLFSRMTAKNA